MPLSLYLDSIHYPFMSVFACLCFVILVTLSCARHIEWAVKNGAYVHPSLQYEQNGMFAKHGPILSGETLVKLPVKLEFRCENCSLQQFTEKFIRALEDDSNFWNLYLKSLPSYCQNPLCAEPNKSILTVLGYKSVKNVLPQPISNESSVITSRQWKTGLLPVMDLFNHNSKYGDIVRPSEDGKSYLLVASKAYEQYEQVYMHYGRDKNVFEMYNRYGFLLDDEFLTCTDMKMMRIGDANKRIECIVNASAAEVTLESMVEELSEAFERKDYPMLKAVAKWLDKNINL